MSKLFEEFSKPSYADWVNQLQKDLKGQPESLIQRVDEIEELSFNSYQHQDSNNTQVQETTNLASVRQINKDSNAWLNLSTIIVNNSVDANKEALNRLNLGATALRFELNSDFSDWKTLTKGVELPYIHTTFKIHSLQQYLSANEAFSPEELNHISFELEYFQLKDEQWSQLASSLKTKPSSILLANGYALQQRGATSWQEIGYCLASAHEAFIQLVNNGLSTEEAATCIHFNAGLGANYFYEIAKLRVLKALWTRILESYSIKDTKGIKITAITGFTNKSLKDPYTNLLRQTTEAMSATFAGVNAICVQAYDTFSKKGATKLSTRMAVNIPLILQEESYLDKVIDPLGGSYVVEYLTNELAEKSWNFFKTLEQKGGVSSADAITYIQQEVTAKATLRIQRIADKTDTLIGINIFPNPTVEDNEWIKMEDYLGLKQLILEQSI
jgi:methylmalonyl-CoA mutase